MPYRVLRDPSQSIQQRMMLYEMMRKGAVSRGKTETDLFFDELEDERRFKLEEDRKERATAAQIHEGEARTKQGQEELDVKTDLGYKKDWREEQGLTSQVGLEKKQGEAAEAQAGASRKHGTLFEAQAAGETAENQRNAQKGQIEFANRRRSETFSNVLAGEELDENGTDTLEKDERLLTGNESYTLPRNPDGSWKVDRKTLAARIMNPDGTPNAAFAQGLREAQRPYSKVGELISDADKRKKAGATAEEMQPYVDAIWKEVTPASPNQVSADVANTLRKAGDYEGMIDALQAPATARRQATSISKLDTKLREERVLQLKTIEALNSIERSYQALKKSKRFPLVAYKQTMFDALAYAGRDDKYIGAFHKKLENFKAKYLLYLSGRAATEQEAKRIEKQVPSRFDSPQTFELALPEFRQGLMNDIAIDQGMAEATGMFVDPTLPIKRPAEVLAEGGTLPNYVTSKGTVSSAEITQFVKGKSVLADRYRKAKEKIGGPEERRDFAVQGPIGEGPPLDPNGMSTEGPPPEDPAQFTDPNRAAALLKRIEKLKEAQRREAEGR